MHRPRPSRVPARRRAGVFTVFTLWCATVLAWAAADRGRRGPGARSGRERGDVPGWVMITLMTAGLVIALWAVAGDRLAALFTQALDAVTKVL